MTIFQFLPISLSTIVSLPISFEIVSFLDDLSISAFSLSTIVSLLISFEIVSL